MAFLAFWIPHLGMLTGAFIDLQCDKVYLNLMCWLAQIMKFITAIIFFAY